MIVQVILVFHILAVVVVLAAFFVNVPWLRPGAVVLAAIAICLPYFLLRASLGRPNPDPAPGQYEMYARKLDSKNGVIYMMVGERGGSWPPRLFTMPMMPGESAGFAGYGGRNYDVIDVTIGDEDDRPVTSNEEQYDLPDPDKDAYYRRLRAESGGGN